MLSEDDFKNGQAFSGTHKGGIVVVFMKCSTSVAFDFGNCGIKSARRVSR